MKRLASILLVLVLTLTLSTSALAAVPQTTKDAFNSATLTPRESINPTLAKYVADVMKEIDPKGTMSTYDKVVSAYNWVAKNIAFAEHYTLPVEVTTYIEDAAIYGFKEGNGPCEVDSATLTYLFRYIGLDAQWALGKKSDGSYHWWTEVIIGNNIYAFDTYPGLAISFSHRTSTVQGETKVNGFPHYGYFVRGGPAAYGVGEGNKDNLITSNVGSMSRMDPPLSYEGTTSITKGYTDGTPSYTWSFPSIGEETVTTASLNKFHEPGDDATRIESNNLVFGEFADKQLTAYKVKIGAYINIEGASGVSMVRLKMVDGKLQTAGAGHMDFDKDIQFIGPESKKVDAGSGKVYEVMPKGSYVSFAREGYYIVEILPWNKYCFDIDPKSPTFYAPNNQNSFRYGYAVIHVVK